jgi:hypothetical protein
MKKNLGKIAINNSSELIYDKIKDMIQW